MNDADRAHMREAIAASRAAMDAGNMPYGAVLASSAGARLFTAQNNQITSGDCTGHAETALVREAAATLGADSLRGATVYASGEPCAMCAGAMFWAGIRRVVFGIPQPVMAEVAGGDLLPIGCAAVFAGSTPPVAVEGPLLQDEAVAVLREFAARP
jgi:tRNA(Arg) A34 adenosine deaminase TadA